jgi:hypothetical protein
MGRFKSERLKSRKKNSQQIQLGFYKRTEFYAEFKSIEKVPKKFIP